MEDWILQIALAVIGLLVGITIVVKIIRKIDKSKTKTTQKNNIVMGDQAGRDINKKG